MSLVFNDAVTEDRLKAMTRALDAALAPGKLKIYSGTQPTPGGTPTGTLLLVMTFPQPSAASYAAGVLILHTPPTVPAEVDGLASWARLEDGSGNWVADCTVGATGSGQPVIINAVTTDLFAGVNVTVNAITLAEV